MLSVEAAVFPVLWLGQKTGFVTSSIGGLGQSLNGLGN